MTRGDFFGYSAVLANEPSPMTVTAAEDLEVLILEIDAVQTMLNKTPRFAQQMSMVIEARQSKLRDINPMQTPMGHSSLRFAKAALADDALPRSQISATLCKKSGNLSETHSASQPVWNGLERA